MLSTLIGLFLLANLPVQARLDLRQITAVPTLMATVTGTPGGVVVTVTSEYDQINVRSGPHPTFPKIGVLLAGQQVTAKGRSPGGEWLLVDYPGVAEGEGWVYSYYTLIPPGSFLPVAESPPTPGPQVTATIDPTLAAQFLVTVPPTRLPTFTPEPPLVVPTISGDVPTGVSGGVPMGLVIIGLATLGAFLGVVSLIRGR